MEENIATEEIEPPLIMFYKYCFNTVTIFYKLVFLLPVIIVLQEPQHTAIMKNGIQYQVKVTIIGARQVGKSGMLLLNCPFNITSSLC